MSTYTQILYQIVFGTKRHESTLVKRDRDKLFKYIIGILKNKKCHPYIINGIENHIHIVTHLHPSVALASLVKDTKLASLEFIKENSLFPQFDGWQNGYSAFTYTISEKERLIQYVKNQEEHHKKVSWKEELVALLKEHKIKYDEHYLL